MEKINELMLRDAFNSIPMYEIYKTAFQITVSKPVPCAGIETSFEILKSNGPFSNN